MDYNAHAYYSDDHGKTFKLSETVNVPGSNESTAAEISNNSVMLNARNQSGRIKARLAVIGSNGGAKWDTSYHDTQLPDPVCEGSILNIGIKNKKYILAFSNAADTLHRDNLTLRISFDEGKTWAKRIPIDKSPVEGAKDFTAYSDLVKMRNNKIGVLYEKEGYAKIVFKVINWKE